MGEDPVSSIYASDEAREIASLAVDVYSSILTEHPWVLKESIITPLKIDKTTVYLPRTSQRITKVKYAASGKCSGSMKSKIFDPGFTKQEEFAPCLSWTKCVPQTYLTTNYAPQCSPINKDESCIELIYLKLDEFLENCRSTQCTNCDSCTIAQYHINIPTNKDPEYWTELDGNIILDSYCCQDANRIIEQRLLIVGQMAREIELRDLERIELPTEFYNYFLSELKSSAFYTIKDRPNEKEEARAQRLRKALLKQNGLGKRKTTDIDFNYGSAWRK